MGVEWRIYASVNVNMTSEDTGLSFIAEPLIIFTSTGMLLIGPLW